MKKAIGITLKVIGGLLAVLLLLAVTTVAYLSFTEYSPEPRQPAERVSADPNAPEAGSSVTLYSWNIGYAGLGAASDFFMDGGKMVDPPSQQAVEENMESISSYIQQQDGDIWLLQELDVDSSRTGSMDQYSYLLEDLGGSGAFTYNYKCAFVPFPIPPMGRVESGMATYTSLAMDENVERISLPCPFSWPMRVANLKRCLLVSRVAVEGTDRELVVINLHLEAYESGEGRIAQTKQLVELMQSEYEKGNYVIAGGDFNQTFPNMLSVYPISSQELWTPGVLNAADLPAGWQFAYDTTAATCRSNDRPYDGTNQLYAIDGFILSPNVQLDLVDVQELDFQHADHNPVRLEVTLLP